MLRLAGRVIAALVVALALLFADAAPSVPSAVAAEASAPVIAAAGDVACDPTDSGFNGGLGTATRCRQKHTSDLVLSGGYDAVLTLGDNQYNSATLSNFTKSYDPSWGRVKAKTYPSIGNHEGSSATSGAGYCSYFGAAAHCNASGRQGNAAFYSFDLGGWHLIALNSNCDAAGGCGVGSPQHNWLVADLRAHPTTCTLAYWHHPRFSSGHGGSNTSMQAIWQTLYDEGADLVLTGHSHNYERFAPQDGSGRVDRARGIRQFVIGTGGAFFTGMSATAPNSELRQNTTFGVFQVTLHPTSYEWAFVPEAGRTFTDAGSESCHGPDTETPPTASASFAPEADAYVSEASAGTNYGYSANLRADGGGDPDVESFLRFAVSGLSGAVQSAKLRLYAWSGTANGPAVHATAGGWSESSLSWSTRPARTSGVVADAGAIAAGSWLEYDVTALVTGNGSVSFVLAPQSSDGVDFYAREGTHKPQLIVTTGGAASPDVEPPSAPSDLTATAVGSGRVALAWAAAADNVGVVGHEIWRDGALLATAGAGTSYTDATVSAATGYRYFVRARDAAGNVSGASNEASVTTVSSLSFAPEADAYVSEVSASTNYGASANLRADGGGDPDVESFLRFAVSGLSGGVQRAKLRLFAWSGTANGPAVHASATAWSESGLSWSTRPARTSGTVADAGAIAAGSWVEYDVTALVTGNGSVSFVLAPQSSDGVDFYAREGTHKPELIVSP